MKNDLISVIIPIYNVEKYLSRCLDSIINQSYKNLEIILVDDGSIDLSSQICMNYVKKDSRINYYKKKNGGLSSARNFGLDIFKGEYVSFIDSDDVVSLDMLKILYDNIKDTNSDISICEVTRFSDKPNFTILNDYSIFSKEDVLKIILEDKKICNYAVNKLYKRNVIKNIRYPLGKVQEDVGTTYKFIQNSNKVVYTESKLYGYYARENSISKTLNKKFIYDYFSMIEQRQEDLKDYGIDDYLILNKVNVILGIFIDISLNKKILKDKELKNYMDEKLKELKILYKIVKNINTTKHNILIKILVIDKNLFCLVMGLYLKIKKLVRK